MINQNLWYSYWLMLWPWQVGTDEKHKTQQPFFVCHLSCSFLLSFYKFRVFVKLTCDFLSMCVQVFILKIADYSIYAKYNVLCIIRIFSTVDSRLLSSTHIWMLFSTGNTRLLSVSYDWINKKIYWTYQNLSHIMAVNADGSGQLVVLTANKPETVVLHPCEGSASASWIMFIEIFFIIFTMVCLRAWINKISRAIMSEKICDSVFYIDAQ